MNEALILIVTSVLGAPIAFVLLSPLSDGLLLWMIDAVDEKPEPQYFGFEGRPLNSDRPDGDRAPKDSAN